MGTKRCRTCGEVKDLSEFSPRATAADGRCGACKPCQAQYHRDRRAADPEKARAYHRDWTRKRPRTDAVRAARRAYARAYRAANPEKERAYERQRQLPVRRNSRRKWRENLRARVLAHYGTACACCGSVSDLQIDHVNGDGKAHREQVGRGTAMYRWLARNGFPEGFQTLCRRCNTSKGKGAACTLDHD